FTKRSWLSTSSNASRICGVGWTSKSVSGFVDLFIHYLLEKRSFLVCSVGSRTAVCRSGAPAVARRAESPAGCSEGRSHLHAVSPQVQPAAPDRRAPA